jgi:hypothetical protein
LYGPGTTDVEVKSMVVETTSESILIGGKSKFIQTTEGEGFFMLVDKHGLATFAKTYASGATGGDIVQKVALQSTTYIAVGTSLTTAVPSTKFFLLTFNNAGVIDKNLQLGTDTAKVAITANVAHMYMQGTDAHVIYDTQVAEIVDTAGTDNNVYIDTRTVLSTVTDNIIKVAVKTPHTIYTVFAVTSTKLHVYWKTAADGNSENVVADTASTVDTSAKLQTGDFDDDANPTKAWIAVYVGSAKINAYHYAISGTAVPTWDSSVQITVNSNPVAMNIMYVSDSSFYISAKLTDLTGSLIKVTGAGAGGTLVVVVKTMVTNLGGDWFLGEYTGTVIITVGTKTGAESATFSSSQAIAFKSTDALDVTAYNCYEITATDGNTVIALSNTVDAAGVTTANIDFVGTDVAQTTSATVPAESTLFVLGPESSTPATVGGGNCKLQPPTFGFTAQTLATTDADDPNTVKAMITHCQGATMTFAPTESSSVVAWATGGSDILIMKPSSVTSAHCCGSANTLSIAVSAGLVSAVIGTDTVSVTITNTAPTITTPAADQAFFQGQGSTTVTGQSITDADTLTFSIATDASASDYTTLTIDTADGNPVTIEMASTYTGTAIMTITATDSYGNTETDAFNVVVSACTQTNCVTCTNSGATDCLSCDSGYTITAGACVQDVVASSSSSSSSGSSSDSSSSSSEVSNLNSGVGDDDSRAGVGTSVAVGTTAVI